MKNQFNFLSRKEMSLILGGENVGGSQSSGPGQTGGCGQWTSSNPYSGGAIPTGQVNCTKYVASEFGTGIYKATCFDANDNPSTCFVAVA